MSQCISLNFDGERVIVPHVMMETVSSRTENDMLYISFHSSSKPLNFHESSLRSAPGIPGQYYALNVSLRNPRALEVKLGYMIDGIFLNAETLVAKLTTSVLMTAFVPPFYQEPIYEYEIRLPRFLKVEESEKIYILPDGSFIPTVSSQTPESAEYEVDAAEGNWYMISTGNVWDHIAALDSTKTLSDTVPFSVTLPSGTFSGLMFLWSGCTVEQVVFRLIGAFKAEQNSFPGSYARTLPGSKVYVGYLNTDTLMQRVVAICVCYHSAN